MNTLIFTYNDNNVFNIGDYIQSLAAMQYAQNDVVYYNRDSLNQYAGDKVKAIMNGWFTHKPENWPPSNCIYPLFVSFHINSSVYEQLLSPTSIAYLKQYEPIGCRDKETTNILLKKGIKAYFSSCLTTTLGLKYKSTGKRDKIYIVDPVHFIPEQSRKYQKYIFLLYYLRYFKGVNSYIKNIQKHNNYKLKINQVSYNRFISIVRSYIIVKQLLSKRDLKNIVVLTQFHLKSEYATDKLRFQRAEELLRMYSTAKLVITSRIHCALPCLGLETPTIFLKNCDDSIESTCRFEGLSDLLNIISFRRNKIIKTPYNLPLAIESIKNRPDYKIYAEKLIDKCVKFFNEP